MSINWVMLNPSGNPPFHALPKETVLHVTNKNIALTIESGKDLPAGDERKKTISCSAGIAYLTNQRVWDPACTANDRLYILLRSLVQQRNCKAFRHL